MNAPSAVRVRALARGSPCQPEKPASLGTCLAPGLRFFATAAEAAANDESNLEPGAWQSTGSAFAEVPKPVPEATFLTDALDDAGSFSGRQDRRLGRTIDPTEARIARRPATAL